MEISFRLLAALALLGGVGVNGARLGLWLSQTDPAPVLAFGRIRLGMTLEEVEVVIGQPPGNYDTKHRIGTPSMGPLGRCVRETGIPDSSLDDAAGRPGPGYSGPLKVKSWLWNDYWIWVAFDDHGKTVGYYLIEVIDDHYPRHLPDFLDQVRALAQALMPTPP